MSQHYFARAQELLFVSERLIRESIIASQRPVRWRTISELNEFDSHTLTGFSPQELVKLKKHLRIPKYFFHQERCLRFTGEESMIILLHWLRHGTAFTYMGAYMFGGDSRRYMYLIRMIVSYLFETFYHKVSGDSMRQWVPSIPRFRTAIYQHLVSQPKWWELLPFEDINQLMDLSLEGFRIFGFIDDFGLETRRPGDAARRREGFEHDSQRTFYSGYFRAHGLKSQVVFLPNGMIGSAYITSFNHNDPGVLNMSGLDAYLTELLDYDETLGAFPVLYGDGIFPLHLTIVPRYTGNITPAQDQFNQRMASSRVSNEHCFGLHTRLFQIFRQKSRLNLLYQAKHVHNMILVSFLIQNCYQCFNHSLNMFDLEPPIIEDYLPLNEVLEPAPFVSDSELGNVFQF